ncbi:type I-E CRISPR-associated protein Cas6/Cse3/CasE [Streptomyces sp. NBC_01754]|uniref:type I-E CRISPR-associated protein Cas6/Cse3/CasE n=1 Tax=Streptomyces sp. NBC_01754 TaxID=2975930 RepID=UPI002DD96236|nr:type I-E CRISPR-associated protein Cas6/Cse3/CasE [Streptomyces sp. NBC_01754]WSC91239.1 type I-E CRISPR-associated protein Cas6/Cse3/CasE [Streptomyces sp. NBC_01754]
MTYLSRIPLAPLRTGARKLLRSPQAMHAAVLGGVAYHPDPGRTLWRLDADNAHRPYLYVLTQPQPDWTALTEQAGWAVDHAHAKPAIAEYKPLLARLKAGQEYSFRLTASPVMSTARTELLNPTQTARQKANRRNNDPSLRRSFRVAHRTADAQLAWLISRAHKHGFEPLPVPGTAEPVPGIFPFTDTEPSTEPIPDVHIARQDKRVFTKDLTGQAEAKTGTTKVSIQTATFEGNLRVTDPVALARSLITGIGPSKAYGCGLLTLAPPATPARPQGEVGPSGW